MISQIIKFNLRQKITVARPNNNIEILRSKIGPYLAGLIEGDGTIAVHETSSSSYSSLLPPKGRPLLLPLQKQRQKGQGDPLRGSNKLSNIKRYNPKIIIVFKKADLPLANYLQNLTKCGTVLIKPERGYVLWQIQDIVSVFTIISIVNGYMRTPKIEALNKGILWLNNYIINPCPSGQQAPEGATKTLNLLPSTKLILDQINSLPHLEIKPIDQSPIEGNA